MILYTIMPWEIVFDNFNKEYIKLMEISYSGEKVLVSQTNNNRYIINRVLSTSPKAFLNPNLQPGTIIQIPPSQEPRV